MLARHGCRRAMQADGKPPTPHPREAVRATVGIAGGLVWISDDVFARRAVIPATAQEPASSPQSDRSLRSMEPSTVAPLGHYRTVHKVSPQSSKPNLAPYRSADHREHLVRIIRTAWEARWRGRRCAKPIIRSLRAKREIHLAILDRKRICTLQVS
jgi:hypothetical protein